MKQKLPELYAFKEKPKSYTAENWLMGIGVTILVIGLLAAFCLFVSSMEGSSNDIWPLVTAISIAIGSIVAWALFRVLANISINLFEIKDKLNK